MFTRKSLLFLSLIVFIAAFSNTTNAKSVYAITDHGYHDGVPAASKISAYDINSTQIDWQTTLELDMQEYPTGVGLGPVALAIDTDSDYLFVTHESMQGPTIYYPCRGVQLIDSETMLDLGWTNAPNSVDIAGIAYDRENKKLYAADRNGLRILIYSWNPNRTLSCDDELTITDQSGQGELTGLTACGLALDEEENLLYVTFINGHYAATNVVYCYSTDDWTFQQRIETTVNGYDRDAVAVYKQNTCNAKGFAV